MTKQEYIKFREQDDIVSIVNNYIHEKKNFKLDNITLQILNFHGYLSVMSEYAIQYFDLKFDISELRNKDNQLIKIW